MPIGSLALQTASSTGQPIGIDEGQKTFRIFFQFKLTGSNPAAQFDTFDLTQLFALSVGGPGSSLTTGSLPIKVEFQSALASAPGANLFMYDWIPGTTLLNGGVAVYTGAAAQTGLTLLSAGAYPAGVLSDLIQGEAIFPKM